MRRMLLTSIALVATAGTLAAHARDGRLQDAPDADEGARHLARELAPDLRRHDLDAEALSRRSVTVKISVNGDRLRTLQVTNWVIGRKLFQLTVPTPSPTAARRASRCASQSKAGRRRDPSRSTWTDGYGSHGGDREAGAFERGLHARMRVRPLDLHVISPIRLASAACSPRSPSAPQRSSRCSAGSGRPRPRIPRDHAASVPGASGLASEVISF